MEKKIKKQPEYKAIKGVRLKRIRIFTITDLDRIEAFLKFGNADNGLQPPYTLI